MLRISLQLSIHEPLQRFINPEPWSQAWLLTGHEGAEARKGGLRGVPVRLVVAVGRIVTVRGGYMRIVGFGDCKQSSLGILVNVARVPSGEAINDQPHSPSYL